MNNNLKTSESISLDFYNNNIKTINVKQYDSATRYLKISCTEHGKFVELNPDTMVAFVRYKKPDGYYVLNDCEIASDGTLLLEFTQQMTIASGRATADVLILDKSNASLIENIEDIYDANLPVLSTVTFYVNVLSTAIEHAEVASSHEYDALITARSSMIALEQFVTDKESERDIAEQKREETCNQSVLEANNAASAANTAATNATNTVTELVNTCGTATQEAKDAAATANIAAENTKNTVDTLVNTCENAVQDAQNATTSAATATQAANEATNRANEAAAVCESVIDGSGIVMKENSVVKDSIRTENSVAAEGSVALGDNVQVLSTESAGFGSDNIVGLKGYYISALDFTNRKIYLSNTQVTDAPPTASGTQDTSFATPEYAEGEQFNIIVPNDHYILCGTIESIANNVLTYTADNDLGFSSFLTVEELQARWEGLGLEWTTFAEEIGGDDYTFSVPGKPTIGVAIISRAGFASGTENIVAGGFGEAGGAENIVAGNFGKTSGQKNIAGYTADAGGNKTKAIGKCSFTRGNSTKAIGQNSSSLGIQNESIGANSLSTGQNTTAGGYNAISSGYSNNLFSNLGLTIKNTMEEILAKWEESKFSLALGHSSRVGGQDCLALGARSEATGIQTKATGQNSKSGGCQTEANGPHSRADGWQTKANGNSASTDNFGNIADGASSHAGGEKTRAKKFASFTHGHGTIAGSERQFVFGKYNEEDTANEYAHIVGGGSSDTDRKNIHTLDWEGNAWYKTLSLGGTHDAPKVKLEYDETTGMLAISVN